MIQAEFQFAFMAVVFRLFKKQRLSSLQTPVGFRLTYTQLCFFHPICINLLELNTKVFIISVVWVFQWKSL